MWRQSQFWAGHPWLGVTLPMCLLSCLTEVKRWAGTPEVATWKPAPCPTQPVGQRVFSMLHHSHLLPSQCQEETDTGITGSSESLCF